VFRTALFCASCVTQYSEYAEYAEYAKYAAIQILYILYILHILDIPSYSEYFMMHMTAKVQGCHQRQHHFCPLQTEVNPLKHARILFQMLMQTQAKALLILTYTKNVKNVKYANSWEDN
jgi:hypothetical protein